MSNFDKEELDELKETLGKRCREVRTIRGFSQEEVALAVGVEEEFYGRLERGEAFPSLETFAKIAEVLGVSSDMLLGLVELEVVVPLQPTPTNEEVLYRRRLTRLERKLRIADPHTRKVVELLLAGFEKAQRN
jgi:transcriptional regulator with XRE-family HTH domain